MANDDKDGNDILILKYVKPVDTCNNMKVYSEMENYFCHIA